MEQFSSLHLLAYEILSGFDKSHQKQSAYLALQGFILLSWKYIGVKSTVLVAVIFKVTF